MQKQRRVYNSQTDYEMHSALSTMFYCRVETELLAQMLSSLPVKKKVIMSWSCEQQKPLCSAESSSTQESKMFSILVTQWSNFLLIYLSLHKVFQFLIAT